MVPRPVAQRIMVQVREKARRNPGIEGSGKGI
jgi:hypothetical protein